jgi:hypothetical protein
MKAVLLLCALFVVAGCLSNEAPAPANDQPGGSSAVPTKDAGSLIVKVTTASYEPVQGASVVLDKTEHATISGADGSATFNNLVPGKYTVLVAKAGYHSPQAKGRIVLVEAEKIAETNMILDPVAVVNEDSSYSVVVPFNGYIACSTQSVYGYTSYCGRGVSPGGITLLRDPNDNSTHPWKVENPYMVGVFLEVEWTPSTDLGKQLYAANSREFNCSSAGTCIPSSSFMAGGGYSPIRLSKIEGTQGNLSKSFGTDPAKFPRQVWADVRSYCPSVDCQFSLTINQRYEAWLSVFYGEEPDPNYTALAKAS